MDLLDGIGVLDLTQLFPGEYATLVLADNGADVVKVERPGVGDIVRERTPTFKGDSRDHAVRNRAKQSLSVDLKAEEGREIFLELATDADVVVESFRPGVVDRLGIGYEDVRAVNDGIVYCSISGFGQDGPRAQDAGYDLNFLAMTGLLSMMGSDAEAPPVPPGLPIVDVGTALTASSSILAALFDRERTGESHHVDVSMAEVAAGWGQLFPDHLFGDEPPTRGEQHYGNHPGNTVYETADGEYLCVCAFDRTWASLCEALGLDEFADVGPDVPPERYDELRAELAAEFSRRPREEWLDLLADSGVAAEPVADLDAVPSLPQFRHRELVQRVTYPDGDELSYYRQPVKVDGAVATDPSPAPLLGEDSAALLTDAGYSDAELQALVDAGVVEVRERDGE